MTTTVAASTVISVLFLMLPLTETQFRSGIITGRNFYQAQSNNIQKRQYAIKDNESPVVADLGTDAAYDSLTTNPTTSVSYESTATPYETSTTPIPYGNPAPYENSVMPYSASAPAAAAAASAVRPEIQVQVYCNDCNVEMYNLTDPNVNHTIPEAIRNMFPFLQF
uniref:LITAF domain-containing protein n=1 Tax=Syphacia muris TaxID=451379 RepID=A0A158R6B4_9BILA